MAWGLALLAGCGPQVPGAGTAPPPETDIFVVETRRGDGGLELGRPVNVTRRAGYDNQPNFLPDGSGFLYTAIREDRQADTWHYDVPTRSLKRVTASLESEFSPTIVPGGDGFSTVRAEPDGILRLWRWPMDGRSPSVILRDVTGVAFHTWIDAQTVALAIARSEDELILEVVDVDSGQERVLARDIGRSLHRFPGGRLVAYVDKSVPDGWLIRILDVDSGELVRSLPVRSGAEDFVVLPDGAIVMAEAQRLFLFPADAEDWEVLADWGGLIQGRITRLAASPDGRRLAVVVRTS